MGQKEITVMPGDSDGHVGRDAEEYWDHHGDYGYEVINKEGERILKFYAAMTMTVGCVLFKMKACNL